MSSLKERFEEIIHMNWAEFLEVEQNKSATVDDTVLCSLVRICADTDDIAATKLAFDRIEGMLETPLQFKIPKFYIRYPNAKEIEGGDKKQIEAVAAPEIVYDPATAKLRDTLKEMRKMPKDVI